MLLIYRDADHVEARIVLLTAKYVGLLSQGATITLQKDPDAGYPVQLQTTKPDELVLTECLAVARHLCYAAPREIGAVMLPQQYEAATNRWLQMAVHTNFEIKNKADMDSLNLCLLKQSFLASPHALSLPDIVFYVMAHSWLASSEASQRAAYEHVVRWFDHIQHLPGITGFLPLVNLASHHTDAAELKAAIAVTLSSNEPTPEKSVKQRSAKEKQSRKKAEKANVQKPEESTSQRPLEDPTRIEIRVGKVLKVWNHPDAERLYCEEIDIGEPSGPRKIASGLREFLKPEEFEGSFVCVIANMKEKKLRGFGSHGMVLCASNADHTQVELIRPPPGAKIGDLVRYEGAPDGEPEPILTTKTGKDAFAAVQPGYRVDENGVAFWKEYKFTVPAGGEFLAATIRNGSLS